MVAIALLARYGNIAQRRGICLQLINYWAGIIGDLLTGPYELPVRLSWAFYLHFLTDELPQLLEDVPLATEQSMRFIHDGAPAHFTRYTKQFLDSHCPDRFTGRNGPILWPPRSPYVPRTLGVTFKLTESIFSKFCKYCSDSGTLILHYAYKINKLNKALTPSNRVLLEKHIVAQLVKIFPSVYATRMFIIEFQKPATA
jgi:hypothetical protein